LHISKFFCNFAEKFHIICINSIKIRYDFYFIGDKHLADELAISAGDIGADAERGYGMARSKSAP
jgi:hypothetical protein